MRRRQTLARVRRSRRAPGVRGLVARLVPVVVDRCWGPAQAQPASSFHKMDRAVSSGGGQSSLDYVFGGDEAPKSAEKLKSVQKPTPPSSAEELKEIPAGIQSSKANNYYRSKGQSYGNFLTDRPSMKLQGPPGGDSQLNYFLGGNEDGSESNCDL